MFKIILKKNILCCLLIGFCFIKAMASGIEPTKKHNENRIIRLGDSVNATDDKYTLAKKHSFSWTDQVSTVKNTISLRIIDTETAIPENFSCDMTLKVEYFTNPLQTEASKTNPEFITLHVDYSTVQGAHYKIADHFDFISGYSVKVSVETISSPGFGAMPPAVLELENSLVVDRTYKFNADLTLGLTGSLESLTLKNVPTNQLQLNWPLTQGAEEYDLEWTTVDNANNEAFNNGFFPDKLFKNNATRITTSDNKYLISLIYNTQYVAVRLRQVHYNELGIRQEGTWDYNKLVNNVPEKAHWELISQAHESNLNWQYSASFAEEGKKKEVVSYFDGTLRARQTTTLNNSDAVSVVQENVYDEFGRPAASILPAPVKANTANNEFLHYFSKLNLNQAGAPYTFQDIINGCEIKPTALDTASGSSRYYSANNQFINGKSFNRYIPDANGYPLSVTQYTPDNTGRIRLQGGVGANFQPGDFKSKTTKYFYGKPEQWELDRLFGNDVGYANHYLKNMVVDPNGQVSVSYLNASGKTIATALTGGPAISQDALSAADISKKEIAVLLRPEQFQFDATALKLSATTTYLSSVIGKAVISYDIEKVIACYEQGTFKKCSSCYYDLAVQVKNDCGVTIYDRSETIAIEKGNFSQTLDSLNFDQIGEYYVNFELSLTRKAIGEQADQYINEGQANGAVKKELNFIVEYLNKLQLSGFGDCHSCSDMLGDRETFNSMFTKKLVDLQVLTNLTNTEKNTLNNLINAKYTELKLKCDALQCPPVSPCQKYALLMEEDVQLGGQYALFTTDGKVLEPEINVLNKYWTAVFNPANLTAGIPESDMITLPNGTQTSPYAPGFTIEDLFKYWKPQWAARFVKYHPESCKLNACEAANSLLSLAWDETVQTTTDEVSQTVSVSGATTAYNPSAADRALWLLKADPFFKTDAPGERYFLEIKADLEQYTNRVLGVTALSSKTLPELLDYLTYCAQPDWTTNVQRTVAWNNCTPEAQCRIPDRDWLDYREKYFELKENYYKRYRNDFCDNEGLCQIGTPITIPLPGSISVNDFRIDEEEVNTDCVGQQRIRISFAKGMVGKEITIQIYYPGQSAPINMKFSSIDFQKFICVPANLEVNTIKVISIIQ